MSPKIWFPNEAANFNPSIKKRKTKEEAAAKRAAKKAKFDPSLPQTVPEILASRAAESQPSEKKAVTQTSQKSGNASIEELRDRLHNKLATLSAQRKGNGAAFSNSPSPAPSNISMGGREALLQESQRNRAEAKAAKKLERKLAKDKAAKEFKAALQKAQQPPDESSSRAAKGKGKAKATQSVDEDAWEDIEAPSSITSAPVSPDAPDDSALAIPSTSTSEQPSVEAQPDDIAFSSLDFAAADSLKPVDVLPDLRRKPRKDAAQHALDRLEDREQFLSKLTPQARERAEEKDKWENATKKASGEKVLDDAARLKKMTKKAEKQKDKSRQKWYVSFCSDPG